MAQEDPLDEQRFRVWALPQLEACGVAPETVSIRYECELQDFSIRIHGVYPKWDQGQVEGIARLEMGGLYISFEDPEADAKFRAGLDSARQTRALAAALLWLKEQNLLEGLPQFDPENSDLASYAKGLEEHCGLDAGSILEVFDPNLLTFRRDVEFGSDAQRRIYYACAASNLSDHGVRFVDVAKAPAD